MRRNRIQINMARLIVAVLVFLLLLPVITPVSAASGTCGDNLSWELTGGVLSITGTGPMTNYSEKDPAPWQTWKDTIRAVIVEEGVTSVGSCAFLGMDQLTSAMLSDSVREIGNWAFSGCYTLAQAKMNGVAVIGQYAFERCRMLTGVRLPRTLQILRYRAFYGCSSLVSITVPVSVEEMETSVFAHCTSLRNATVLAGVSELPNWTFYNCKNLEQVTLVPTIKNVGYEAFYECIVEEPVYGHVGEQTHSTITSQQQDDKLIIINSDYVENDNAMVDRQIIATKTQSGKTVEMSINAVLENAEGWSTVEEQVNANESFDSTIINVWLKEDTKVSGENLKNIAGKNIRLTIHTSQGVSWSINGQQLTGEKLAKEYDLSYTLKKLDEPDKKHAAALQGHTGYILIFHGVLDFKVEVELPFGKELSCQSAVFFAEEKNGYRRCQAVMIDEEGTACFYLGQVDSDVEHLIGINVPQQTTQGNQTPVSDVIIPDSLKHQYPQMAPVEEFEYVVTDLKSSWGISFWQLTLILLGGMIICAVVVAIIMRMQYKKKLESGYMPDMGYTDEE